MYEDFLPLQKKVLTAGSAVIPGIPEAVAELRSRGLKIGSTTGYTREIIANLTPVAAAAGYARNDDFNGPSQEGVGFYQLTVRNGWRVSAAVA